MSQPGVASRAFNWLSVSVDMNRGVAYVVHWLFAAMSTAPSRYNGQNVGYLLAVHVSQIVTE